VLKRAQAKHSITFPLLSDAGSKTIEAYGILNKDAAGPAKGIPHPMTFVVDKLGVIRAKLCHEGYTKRHSSEDLIQASKDIR
jgi:peroxiredoxin